jgi:putative transposase
MIDVCESRLSVASQCQLLSLPHSTCYYEPVPLSSIELDLMSSIEKFHFCHPTYGSRRLSVQFSISRDKAIRLMRDMHIVATYPQRKTTIPNIEHKKYPYLLRNITPDHANHIWSTDITYIGLSQGFMYLTAIIDWHSRMQCQPRLQV